MTYLRHNIAKALKRLSGHDGQFSEAMCRYWQKLEQDYRACNQPGGVPDSTIPLWWARAQDLKIPVAAEPVKAAVPEGPPPEPAKAKNRGLQPVG